MAHRTAGGVSRGRAASLVATVAATALSASCALDHPYALAAVSSATLRIVNIVHAVTIVIATFPIASAADSSSGAPPAAGLSVASATVRTIATVANARTVAAGEQLTAVYGLRYGGTCANEGCDAWLRPCADGCGEHAVCGPVPDGWEAHVELCVLGRIRRDACAPYARVHAVPAYGV